jgi:hypothetical protein
MIQYSQEEAISFAESIDPRTGYPLDLKEPNLIIEKVIQMHVLGNTIILGRRSGKTDTFNEMVKYKWEIIQKIRGVLFFIPLENLPLYLNEPKYFMPFIEWRLKTGK